MEDAKTCRPQDAKDKTEGQRDESWSLAVLQSWRPQQIQTVEISRMELTKDARTDTLQASKGGSEKTFGRRLSVSVFLERRLII